MASSEKLKKLIEEVREESSVAVQFSEKLTNGLYLNCRDLWYNEKKKRQRGFCMRISEARKLKEGDVIKSLKWSMDDCPLPEGEELVYYDLEAEG